MICNLAVEADSRYISRLFHGDSAAADRHLRALIEAVSAIFEREVNLTLRLSYFHLWTTADDPYESDDIEMKLAGFRSWWLEHHADVPRDMALIATGQDFQGAGESIPFSLGVRSGAFAAASLRGGGEFPDSLAGYDVKVVAHELGHVIGSFETHDCNWQGYGFVPPGVTLDSCARDPYPCNSVPAGLLPPGGGTIMSYCPKFRLTFHPVCRQLLRAEAEYARLEPASIQPPRWIAAAANDAGALVRWDTTAASGATYRLYAARDSLGTAPVLLAETGVAGYQDQAWGDRYYTVRAVRGDSLSPGSGLTHAILCPPLATALPRPGSQPRRIQLADLNLDGRLDLVALGAAESSVAVTCADPAAPLPVPFRTWHRYPFSVPGREFAVADFNADGIPDIVVLGSGEVSFLFGRGDGTFLPPVVRSCDPDATSLAVADLDGNLVPDLMLVCGGAAGRLQPVRVHPPRGQEPLSLEELSPVPTHARPFRALRFSLASESAPRFLVTYSTADLVTLVTPAESADSASTLRWVCQDFPTVAGGMFGAVTDADGDGTPDLVVANSLGAVAVHRGVVSPGGVLSFGTPAMHSVSQTTFDLAVADLSGGGLADILLATSGGIRMFQAHRPSEAGLPIRYSRFDLPVDFPERLSLTVGDVTGDGVPDPVVGTWADSCVLVLASSCRAAGARDLSIVEPDGREAWLAGSIHQLSWKAGEGVRFVDVDFSGDGGRTWWSLATHLSGSFFTWRVPAAPTSHGVLRVRDSFAPATASQSRVAVRIVRPPPGVPLPGNEPHLVSVAPNPASSRILAWVYLPDARPVSLELLDVAGRRVAGTTLARPGGGYHLVENLKTDRLASGVYFLRIAGAGGGEVRRIAIVR